MNFIGSSISLPGLTRRPSVTRPISTRSASNYEAPDSDDHDDPLTAVMQAIKDGRYTEASDMICYDNRIAHRSDEHGRTALHYAAQAGQDDLVNELLALGADPDAEIIDSRHTPLHLAAQKGHTLVVETLLEAGSNPSAQNKSHKTPLHYAAERGHRDVVEKLLAAGADRTIVDRYGSTSGSLADKSENLPVIELFEQPQILQKSPAATKGQPNTARVAVYPPSDPEKAILCRYFRGIMFSSDGDKFSKRSDSVFDIIYGSEHAKEGGENVRRVVYLPANNKEWILHFVDKIREKLASCSMDGLSETERRGSVDRIKAFVDKTFERTGRNTAHRRPHFSQGPGKHLWAAVIPVLDVDMDEESKFSELHGSVKPITSIDDLRPDLQSNLRALYRLEAKYARNVHMPRSLDRAYYEFLSNEALTRRDKDQVMLRYVTDTLKRMKLNEITGSAEVKDQVDHDINILPDPGYNRKDEKAQTLVEDEALGRLSKESKRKEAALDDGVGNVADDNAQKASSPQILVVRQLWLWRLDENTMIASFPTRWDTNNSVTLLNQIECAIQEFEPKNISDVCKTILECCIEYIDIEYCICREPQSHPYNCRGVFASSIADLAEATHKQYRKFQERLVSGKPNHTLLRDLYDEMNYLEKIDDILDELTMVKRALSNQAYQANRALEAVSGSRRQKAANLAGFHSHPYLEVFERLTEDARRVRKCITTLLDLRQKEATIDEVMSSANQSKLLFFFAVATVIFAPLSFGTSLMSLNIDSFQETFDLAWVIGVLFAFLGTTVAILCVAYALQWLYNSDRRKVSGATGAGGDGGGIGGSASQAFEQLAPYLLANSGTRHGAGGKQGLTSKSWRRLQLRGSRRMNARDLDMKFLDVYA